MKDISPRKLPRTLIIIIFLASQVLVFPATASGNTAKKITRAWVAWVSKKKIKRASIAVFHNQKLLKAKGIAMEPENAVPVASLSKAITGICIAKLVESGRLAYDDTIEAIAPKFKSGVSIRALLTHSSGYTRDAALSLLPRLSPGKSEYLAKISLAQIRTGQSVGEGKKFRYNNGNYAMLGAIVARVTGKSYEKACLELVLKPAGITKAHINRPWRVMSSWGGWRISAIDYGRFINAYFSKKSVSNVRLHRLPKYRLNANVSYGLGYFFRKGANGGYNYWHAGDWNWKQHGKTTKFGAFFAKWDSGWTVVVTHNTSLRSKEITELDRLLWSAAHQ